MMTDEELERRDEEFLNSELGKGMRPYVEAFRVELQRKKQEEIDQVEEKISEIFEPFPEGLNKGNAHEVPSGFVDEPDVYDELVYPEKTRGWIEFQRSQIETDERRAEEEGVEYHGPKSADIIIPDEPVRPLGVMTVDHSKDEKVIRVVDGTEIIVREGGPHEDA